MFSIFFFTFTFYKDLSLVNMGTFVSFPAGIYPFKVNNNNTRTKCEICLKLTIKTPKRRQLCSSVSIVNFEQVNAGLVWTFCIIEFAYNRYSGINKIVPVLLGRQAWMQMLETIKTIWERIKATTWKGGWRCGFCRPRYL